MYTVIFNDNSQFIGGSINDSKWNEMPNKPIKKLTYYVKNTYGLSGFEKYNHLVTKVITVSPKIKEKSVIYTELFLMGLRNQIVYMIIVDLMTGKVRRDARHSGSEYNGRKSEGWKLGISSGFGCQIGRIQ
ncbi:MAG TPA: hypothetical protein ENI61_00660 [Ignavibacteria bacterium]|nr:hypothetical protein [Ignavibacteria bacterium]